MSKGRASARFHRSITPPALFSELRAILLVWNLGLRPQPGLSSRSPRSATTRQAGSP